MKRVCWMRSVAIASTATAMAVLLSAGLLKGADVASFIKSLTTWRLLPNHIVPFIAMALPAIEIAIGLAWFLNLRRRLMALCALGLVLGFTMLYVVHVVLVGAPDCGCLGLLRVHRESTAQIVVSTNVRLAT